MQALQITLRFAMPPEIISWSGYSYSTVEGFRVAFQRLFNSTNSCVVLTGGLLNRPNGQSGQHAGPEAVFEVTVDISCWKVNQTMKYYEEMLNDYKEM